MAKKYYKSQEKATAKYMENRHTFRVVVTNDRRDIIKAHAERFDNGSVNAFINRAIDYMMEIDAKINLTEI